MAFSRADTYNRALDNYARILVLCTQAIAETRATGQASQATIDAAVALADGSGIVRPKINYSADGESYDWAGYQSTIVNMQRELMRVAQLAAGPYFIRSRGSV